MGQNVTEQNDIRGKLEGGQNRLRVKTRSDSRYTSNSSEQTVLKDSLPEALVECDSTIKPIDEEFAFRVRAVGLVSFCSGG